MSQKSPKGSDFQYHVCMRNSVSLFPEPVDHLGHPFEVRLVSVLQRRKHIQWLDRFDLGHFKTFQNEWNAAVLADRQGARVTLKEYLHRRKLSSNPLRLRSWHRTTSMPLSKPLRDALKGQVDLDWRKVTKARLLRFGDRVALSYVQLEPITKNLNRDPRLSNVGICLTDKGMTLVLQGPSDTLHPVHIPKEQLTQNYIKQFVQQMIGKIQVVGLDPTVPPSMRDIRTYLIRRLRNTQAEGAIVFRSLKRVSLGDRYLNRPVWDKQRPKLWQRKLLSQWAGYSVIMDLTGKPLLAKEESGGLVTGPLDKSVNPFIRANDAIQSVMAKLDLSPSATFLRSSDRQRVQRAFHRHSQRTIKATATKRTGT